MCPLSVYIIILHFQDINNYLWQISSLFELEFLPEFDPLALEAVYPDQNPVLNRRQLDIQYQKTLHFCATSIDI